MKRTTHDFLAAAIIIGCLVCDRVTKDAARALQGEPPIQLFGGTITLLYAENPGAMLSVGSMLPDFLRFWVLTVGVGLLVAGLLAYLLLNRRLPPVLLTAMSLMVGGGTSNLYDRLTNNGKVVDFVMLGAGAVRTGVFNVADIAITAGVILFFLSAFRKKATTAQ